MGPNFLVRKRTGPLRIGVLIKPIHPRSPHGSPVVRVGRRRNRRGRTLGFNVHVINRRKPMGHAMCFPECRAYGEMPESNAR
jgi:hypothetical protein